MKVLDNIPQPLYKYRVWDEPCKDVQYSRRILTESEVYLASPDQLNDPFDTALPFRYRKEDLTPDNIFKKLYELGKEMWPEISTEQLIQLCYERQNQGGFENGAYWLREFPSFKSFLNDNFGVLSLTSKNDDLLMWSHYADCYRGFCVGLDKHLLFECCAGQLAPVTYDPNNELPEVGLFDDPLVSLATITTTKSRHWSYEDEYRIVRSYSSRVAYTLPREAILEIILGCNMPAAYKDQIYALAAQSFPQAKIFETRVSDNEFKLELLPIIKK